jgi:hypothetical protein
MLNFKTYKFLSEATKDLYAAMGKTLTDSDKNVGQASKELNV